MPDRFARARQIGRDMQESEAYVVAVNESAARAERREKIARDKARERYEQPDTFARDPDIEILEEYVIGFNPDILANAASALGAGGPSFRPLIVRFCRTKDSAGPTGLRPMVLTIDQGGGNGAGRVRELDSMAILMPIRVNR